MTNKKILGISATQAKRRKSSSEFLLDVALNEAKKFSADTKKIKLTDYHLYHCEGCSNCMQLKPCPLSKKENDQALELFNIMDEADAFIISYPVYGYLPPELIFKVFHRFAPKKDLQDKFSRYLVDITSIVKGWPIINKEVGIICTGATTGMDSAIQSIYNPLRGLRANIIISVGIGLAEYDCSPHLAKKPFARNIEDADFAIEMAQAVGERVALSVSGFDKNYRFKDPYITKEKENVAIFLKKDREETKIQDKEKVALDERLNLDQYWLYDFKGEKISLKDIIKEKLSIFIIGGPLSIDQNLLWTERLDEKYKNTIEIFPIAEIDAKQLTFPKEFLIGKIKELSKIKPALIDWDICFDRQLEINFAKSYSTILIINKNGFLADRYDIEFSDENFKKITQSIDNQISSNKDLALEDKKEICPERIYINGINLSYLRIGNGEPILILHGNRDRKEYFIDIINALSLSFEVYVLDLRGHGESDKPQTGYSLDHFLSDVKQFIEIMKFKSFDIIGHSLGATIALKIALENKNVNDLILLGTSAYFHPDFRPDIIKGSNIFQTQMSSDIQEQIQEYVAPFFFSDHYPHIKKMIMQHWKQIPGAIHRALVMELKHPDMRNDISKIDNRTLIIAGEKDQITKLDECKFIADNLANGNIKIIKNTGHFMYLEKPDEVIKNIKEFLLKR